MCCNLMRIGLQINNNLNFAKKSIYAVDACGGVNAVKKFDSITEASQELNIPMKEYASNPIMNPFK